MYVKRKGSCMLGSRCDCGTVRFALSYLGTLLRRHLYLSDSDNIDADS